MEKINVDDIKDWDEEIEHEGDIFKVKHFKDGSRILHCPRNKRGFRLTMHVGGTEEEKREAQDAVRRFYINNMMD